jgi:hypothetical protein
MRYIWIVFNCGASSICMTPTIFKLRKISRQAAHINTLGMTGGVMQNATDCRKTRLTVKY